MPGRRSAPAATCRESGMDTSMRSTVNMMTVVAVADGNNSLCMAEDMLVSN